MITAVALLVVSLLCITVRWTRAAEKSIKKRPELRQQIEEKIQSGSGIKPLNGHNGLLRVRKGSDRAICQKEVDGDDVTYTVLNAGPRGDIYKGLGK